MKPDLKFIKFLSVPAIHHAMADTLLLPDLMKVAGVINFLPIPALDVNLK